MEELSACPFCGGVGSLQHDDDRRWAQVVCGGCGAKAMEHINRDDLAAHAWNRRAAPPAQAGREPTEAMTTAGFSAWLDTVGEDAIPGHQTVTIIWQAMYDAAPLTRIER